MRIPDPSLLPLYRRLVHRAKTLQHGSLTAKQYRALEAEYFKARKPVGVPMFAWAIQNCLMLRRQLAAVGVTVRPEPIRKLHRFKLPKTGMGRLTEIERKIRRQR